MSGHGKFSFLTVVMNLTVYPLLVLWTALGIVVFPVLFVLWKCVTRWHAARIVRHFIWVYGRGWMLIVAPFVRFEREQLHYTAEVDSPIIVANHLSFFDTYCMAALPLHDVVFAVRSWPFRIFFYSRFMRLARYLEVESASWEEIRDAAIRTFEEGACLLFFPEGHRSRTGKMKRFHSGAFKLSVQTGRPIVPLCIVGTDTLLPPGRFWLQPARVKLRALPPVDPSPFQGPTAHLDLRRFVKEKMTEALDRARAEEAVTDSQGDYVRS